MFLFELLYLRIYSFMYYVLSCCSSNAIPLPLCWHHFFDSYYLRTYRTLGIVVTLSFFFYLLTFFIFQRVGWEEAVDRVSGFLFSLLWFILIMNTTHNLVFIRKQLNTFFKTDGAAQKVSKHLLGYCEISFCFGIPLCIFQALSFWINHWFVDDISATIVNYAYDISCLGSVMG